MRNLNRKALLLAGGVMLAAGPAFAQATIEEITVTAQKRVESKQDVPISVTAVTGDALENKGVFNFEDFQTPGVKIARGGMSDGIAVRGISSGPNLGFEQAVPMYIDGVYFGRGRVQRLAFLDVQQIEVLKGPQPTYFGKNAIGGAINITNKKPGDSFEADLDASYEFEQRELALGGSIAGPLSDNFSARLAAKYRSFDGYMSNTATGKKEPQTKDLLGRAAFRWQASDALTLNFSVYAGQNTDRGRNNQMIFCAPALVAAAPEAATEGCSLDLRKSSASFLPDLGGNYFFTGGELSFYNRLNIAGGNLNADYDFGSFTLTSVTAYYKYQNKQFSDTDQTARDSATATFLEKFDQFSQELRATSAAGTPFQWMMGAYYDSNNNDDWSSSNARNNNPSTLTALPPPLTSVAPPATLGPGMAPATTLVANDEKADSWAVFAEASYPVLDSVIVKAGVRYEEVKKSDSIWGCMGPLFSTNCSYGLSFERTNPAVLVGTLAPQGTVITPGGILSRTLKATRTQPVLTLEWRPVTDVMLYATRKEGFKAGGFDHALGRGVDATEAARVARWVFAPEKATTYEAGAKTYLFDRAVLLNASLFRTTIRDLQVSQFNVTTGVNITGNAAELRSEGLELEGQWAATDHLTFSGNVTFLNSKYVRYPGASCYPNQTVAQGCVVVGGASIQDLSGARTPYAPKVSLNLSANYRGPVSDTVDILAGVDYFYTDDFIPGSFNNDPRAVQASFSKIDARLGLAATNSTWEVAVVGKNLTDEITAAFINAVPGGGGTLFALTERPRSVGLQAKYKF